MAPMITLYILGGCVAAAVLLFIVMIVLSALRPPPLPELSFDPAPLQRMIRALTPLPIAAAAYENTEPKTTPYIPRPMPPPAPLRRPHHVPAPPPPPPVPAPIAMPVAPSPFVWEMPKPPPVSVRAVSLPPFPAKRRRRSLRFCVWTFVLGVLASGAVVAYPPLLDIPCDDYEWFGAESAQVVREHAWYAHDEIKAFIDSL